MDEHGLLREMHAQIVTLPGVVTSQNLALNKPVLISSQGGNPYYHPPSAANDGDYSTTFFTYDSPWSFAAVDLENIYEIASISLKVSSLYRK